MSEEKVNRKKTTEPWSFVPTFIDKMFGTVESFAERLLAIVADSADGVVSRGVQRLFGLLLIILGIAFILTGIAKVINQIFDLVGVGEIVAGILLLSVTALVTIVVRKQ